jgi:dCMP deaminase
MNNRPDWDKYFMDMIDLISSRSLDPNTKVGAIIVDEKNFIVSTGYNSFPSGVNDSVPERYERPEKYFWIEHGDRNAIYAAARRGTKLDGTRMYLPGLPCMDCARGIIQSGIVEVIINKTRQDAWALTTPKYGPDFARVKTLLSEAGVKLREW